MLELSYARERIVESCLQFIPFVGWIVACFPLVMTRLPESTPCWAAHKPTCCSYPPRVNMLSPPPRGSLRSVFCSWTLCFTTKSGACKHNWTARSKSWRNPDKRWKVPSSWVLQDCFMCRARLALPAVFAGLLNRTLNHHRNIRKIYCFL